MLESLHRGVAQPGSAPALGAGGPRFKSARPDHLLLCFQFTLADTVCIRGDEGLYWLRISSKPSLKWRHSDLNQVSGHRTSHGARSSSVMNPPLRWQLQPWTRASGIFGVLGSAALTIFPRHDAKKEAEQPERAKL